MIPITITILRIFLILTSIGMKELTNHRRTPTTTSTITIPNSDIIIKNLVNK
jgi:hypothetical protein